MTQTQPTPTHSPRTAAIELVREIHARFSAGKLESCLELVTDDVEVNLYPMGQTFRGREEFVQFMQVFHSAFPDISLRHTNHVVDGDQLVVEFTWNGTNTGSIMTPAGAIPPTGKRVAGAHVMEVFRLRDGKVARIGNYQDVAAWMRQIGLA
jgi:steroid delta-isomerase-like uncharacterized protein